MLRLLVFSPFSGIWPHGLSEAQLLEQLDPELFSITVVNCKGLFSNHCVVMESFGLDHNDAADRKMKICRTCRSCTSDLANAFNFRRLWLDDFSNQNDLSEANEVVTKSTLDNYGSLTLDGLEIGRLCSYDTLIKFKKTSMALSVTEFNHFQSSLRLGVLSFRATQRLLSGHTFDAILIYSPQYAANLMCAEVAAQFNVPCYFLEGSSNLHERYRALRIWSWPDFRMVNPALSYYSSEGVSISSQEEERVSAHFKEISLGRSFSVYSPKLRKAVDVRKIHGIQENRKILLAALSSYDEAFSAVAIGGFPKEKFESDVFLTQFDWIDSLIRWVSKKEDIHLVVRLHPRDLPNRRDSVVSEQIARWTDILAELPSNVTIDHPNEKIPLANYFPKIAAFTTGWSSTGIEALANRIPVVTYDERLPSYPKTIHLTGRSGNQYWENLETALAMPHEDTIREKLFCWLSFNFNRGSIRVRGRLFDQSFVQQNIFLYYLVGVVAKYLPTLAQRIDTSLGRHFPVHDDSWILNQMLANLDCSLYEVDQRNRS